MGNYAGSIVHFDTSSGRAFRELARPIRRGRGPPRSGATAIPDPPIFIRASWQERVRTGITVHALEPLVGAGETEA